MNFRYLTRCVAFGLSIGWLFVFAANGSNQAPTASEIESLLPADEVTADVMELAPSPRMVELSNRMKTAVQQDPEWWLAHVKKAKPGEPLPYDPKLGLTEEEFKELLELSKNLTYRKVRTSKLTVKRNGNVITIAGGKELPELNGIRLNLAANQVETPFGTASEQIRIKATEGQRATGPWSGIQWKLEEVKDGRGTVVKFALGRMKEGGRGILYYDVVQVGDGSKKKLSYLLKYDLKPAT